VSWQTPMPVALWSDTVWVFVDYNKNGVMERLPLSTGATLTATSPGGKVIEEPDNNKGVWVAGNARTNSSFSATVKLLTAVKKVGGACAYASNYPPVGKYQNNAAEISFTGTPMYDLVIEKIADRSTYTISTTGLYSIRADEVIQSFTDATGASGRLTPPYAASTQIWTVGNQIWSDAINVPACDHDAFTADQKHPYCRSYTTNGKKWYYYNWVYVKTNLNTLCPSPWRVPTANDFIALDKVFGGSGSNRTSVALSWITEHYVNTWGGIWANAIISPNILQTTFTSMEYWSATQYNSYCNYGLMVYTDGTVSPLHNHDWGIGYLVRCVK
jgi:uncharacterized protein (TIGR02145 family)